MNVFCMGIFYVKANQEKFILSTGEPYGLATLFCNKKKKSPKYLVADTMFFLLALFTGHSPIVRLSIK